jgi:hypothetical protein
MKDICGFLGKEMNKALISVGNNNNVKSISNFAMEKASEFGLENEIKRIKAIGDNPEKLVDEMAGALKEGLIDPSTIVARLNQARDGLVLLN